MRGRLLAAVLLLNSGAAAFSQAPRTLSLTFLGDIMAHDVNYRMADYGDIYRGIADLFSTDDLTVANLELTVDATRPESGYPYFNGPPAYVRAAIDAGIDVFSTANNHAFDGGEAGIFQTLRSLAALRGRVAHPFFSSGIRGNPRQPFQPATIVVKGVRIGFIAVSQFLNVPDRGRYVNVFDFGDAEAAEGFLSFVRSTSAQYDLLIVSYHGDREYIQEPSPLKRDFFRRLLEAGAHIVFSHHPHVVQGYEVARVKGIEKLIMYSMGNFISGMAWRLDPVNPSPRVAATGEGYVLSVQVRCARDGCRVTGAAPVPIADYRNGRGDMVVGRMSDLADGRIPLSARWKAYYTERLARMRLFLTGSVTGGPG